MLEDIILLIRGKNLLPELINEIHSWHADCEAGNAGECDIYDAIQKGVGDDALLKIAYDVDPDLFEKYLAPAVRAPAFEDWWREIGSGIVPLPGSDMESHAEYVAWLAWEKARLMESKTDSFEIIDENNPNEKIGIKVIKANDGLFIQPDNYYGDVQNAPLKIDYFDGKLSVMLWHPMDIHKQSDPSLTLELKGYTEADEKRFDYEEENGIF